MSGRFCLLDIRDWGNGFWGNELVSVWWRVTSIMKELNIFLKHFTVWNTPHKTNMWKSGWRKPSLVIFCVKFFCKKKLEMRIVSLRELFNSRCRTAIKRMRKKWWIIFIKKILKGYTGNFIEFSGKKGIRNES